MNIKQVVERTDSPAGKAFDFTIQGLIVVSLITFSVETIPGLSESIRHVLATINAVTVIIFTAEYLLRILVADNKPKFIFSFYGLVDLVAILPFYLSTGVDLRSIRILRLLRLARLLKFFRFSRALDRFRTAFYDIRAELTLFLAATIFLLYVSAVGIYYFENPVQPEAFGSVFHSMWWAVATLTTVGYGDVYPVTVGGRIFTFVVLMVGLGLVAVPAGLVASAFTEAMRDEDNTQEHK